MLITPVPYYVGARTPGISHYFPARSREEAEARARMAARHAPGCVWIEGQLSASGREGMVELRRAAEVDTRETDAFAADFPLTPEERERLDTAPFPNNPDNWVWFTVAVTDTLLQSYAKGEMDFRRMLATMRNCALGCPTGYRLMTLGRLADRALSIKPAESSTRGYPPALQWLAAGLVEEMRQKRPDDKLQTILADAIAWLTTVGICEKTTPISTGTLKNWYLEHKRGRPSNRSRPTAGSPLRELCR